MEKTYYTNGNVSVTNKRFMVDAQTYALSGITSVKFDHAKPSRGLPIVVLIGGLLIAKTMPGAPIWLWLTFAAPGVIWLACQRSAYSVTLNTASGEGRALTSKDAKFIRGVIDALNQAIIERG